jgi:hypothetical protein
MWRRRLAIASPQTGEDTITTIFVFHHASRTLPSQSGGRGERMPLGSSQKRPIRARFRNQGTSMGTGSSNVADPEEEDNE